MYKSLILYSPEEVRTQTALSASEQIWSHAYHDSKRIFGAYAKAFPLAATFSIIAAAVAADSGADTKSVITTSITAGCSLSAAYLARTVYEARKKLDFMRKSFAAAAQTFQEHETKLTAALKEALDQHRPYVTEMFNFKKYPVRTSLAFAFAVPAAFAAGGQTALISIGALAFLTATAIGEEDKTMDISKAASKATKYIQTVNKMKLQGLEI